MSTVMAEEKKIPTITPASNSVCTGKPPLRRRSRRPRCPPRRLPANANAVIPTASTSPPPSPNTCASDHAERGAARHPEHRGLGERIPRQALKADARHGERAAREQGRERCAAGAGSAPRPGPRARIPCPVRTATTAPGGHRRAAQEERADRHERDHQSEPDHSTARRAPVAEDARVIVPPPGRRPRGGSGAPAPPGRPPCAGRSDASDRRPPCRAAPLHRRDRVKRSHFARTIGPAPWLWLAIRMTSGVARDGRLHAIARVPLAAIGGDRVAAGQGDQLGDERAPRGHDERVRPEHVEHARARATPPRASRRPGCGRAARPRTRSPPRPDPSGGPAGRSGP